MNESVCIPSNKVLDLLTALVDASLVVYEEQPDGIGRYRLLETTRQYAVEMLNESEEKAAVRAPHQAFFAALAEEAEPHLAGAEQTAWLNRLETEHNNLRAALALCELDMDNTDVGLRLASSLYRFWDVRGYLSEGREFLHFVLSKRGAAGRTARRAKALEGAGCLAHTQGDYQYARSLLQESLAICQEIGDRHGKARLLYRLASIIGKETGLRLGEESLVLSRELEDKEGIALALRAMGITNWVLGDLETGRRLCEEGLEVFRELEDQEGIAQTLHALAGIVRFQSDHETALKLYKESLAIFRKIGHRSGIALSLRHLGILAEYKEDFSLARSLYEECLAIWMELGNKPQVAWGHHGLGFIAFRENDYVSAHKLLKDGLTIFREIGHKDGQLWSLERLAGLAMAQGRRAQAGRLLAAAEKLREAMNIPLPLPAHQERDRNVDAIRTAIGEDTFTAVWAEGRAMTIEQAIACALQEYLA